MDTLAANDPHTLPDPVLERLLAVAIRLTAPVMSQPGVTIVAAAQLLIPYLNALPRSCAPHLSYAVIMQCPWIDANVASVTNNLWLLNTLAHKLAKAPYHRAMQYRDWDLLDRVSAKGFVDVLDWWHKSDFIIGHDNPLQAASTAGHVDVLNWWLGSGRLRGLLLDPDRDMCFLLEPTKKGDIQVLCWWLKHFIHPDSGQKAISRAADGDGGGELDWPTYLKNHYAKMIAVALRGDHVEVAQWWIDACMQFGEISDAVMGVLFASGKMDWVHKHLDEFKANGGQIWRVIPYAAFSADLKYIEACLVLSGAVSCSPWIAVAAFASCAGHVHVLDWLQSIGGLNGVNVSEVLAFSVMKNDEIFWGAASGALAADAILLPQFEYSMLDLLAFHGRSTVLEWWFTFDKKAFCKHILGARGARKLLFVHCVGFAICNNHVVFLDSFLRMLKQTTVPELDESCSGLFPAAARGHLEAIEWYWNHLDLGKLSGQDKFWAQVAALECVLHAALATAQVEVVEWAISTWHADCVKVQDPENQASEDICEIVRSLLQCGVKAPTAEWLYRSADRLGFTGSVIVCIDDVDDLVAGTGSDHSPAAFEPADYWLLLNLVGGTTPSGNATFVPSARQFSLLESWKGYPLFLERLLSKSHADPGKQLLTFPLDLDWACEAQAGVAVYDWMYSYRNKGKDLCVWSSKGQHCLTDNLDKNGLKWWEKMDLPVGPRSISDHSDEEPWEEHSDSASYEDDDSVYYEHWGYTYGLGSNLEDVYGGNFEEN